MMALNTWPGPEISGEESRDILRWALDEGLDRMFGVWRSRTSNAALINNGMPPAQGAIPEGYSLAGTGVGAGTQLPASHAVADTIITR
jgi:hypothetical protein